MIFYFTGTGNSLAVARVIAEKTGDMLVSIGSSYKYKDFDFTLEQGEPLGFVFPTYQWTTPPLIDAFIKRAHFRTGNQETYAPEYCYVALTCGAFVGNTARHFSKALREHQGINVDASFSVKSVGNCTYLYAPAEGDKRKNLVSQTDTQAQSIACQIANKDCVHAERRNPLGILFSAFTNSEEKPRPTSEFYTLPTCIHCGKCAKMCPTNTITLIDNEPRWAELGCTRCLACLHRCPTNSIQYGKKTETRGRYVHPVMGNR